MKHPSRRPLRASLVLLPLALCALAGCQPAPQLTVSGQRNVEAASSGRVTELGYGIAYAGGRLDGAQVELLGLDGKPLGPVATHGDLTHTSGNFFIAPVELPTDFAVVARGGKAGGKAFEGELRAEVRGFRRYYGPITVSPVSTVVSAYMARHPEAKLADATTKVRTCFGIPRTTDLGRELLADPSYFNPATWEADVQRSGGLQAWVAAAVADAEAGWLRPIGLARPLSLQQAGEDLNVDKLLQQAARGALLPPGVDVPGFLIPVLGMTATQSGFAALKSGQENGFNRVTARLDELETTVGNLEHALAARVDYDTWYPGLDELLEHNAVARHDLETLADALDDNEEQAERDRLRTQLNDYIDENFKDVAGAWHRKLALTATSDGGIRLWNRRVAAADAAFFTAQMATQIQAWWDYIDLQQYRAIELKLNRLHDLGAGQAEIKKLLVDYAANRKVQLQTLRGATTASYTNDISALDASLPAETIQVQTFPGNLSDSYVLQKANTGGGSPRQLLWRKTLERYQLHELGDTSVNRYAWTIPVVEVGPLQVFNGPAMLQLRSLCSAKAQAATGLAGWDVARYFDMVSLFNASTFKSQGFAFDGAGIWANPIDDRPDNRYNWYFDTQVYASHPLNSSGIKKALYMYKPYDTPVAW